MEPGPALHGTRASLASNDALSTRVLWDNEKPMCQCILFHLSTAGAAFNQMGRYYQNGDWALFMYGAFTTSVG